MTGKAALIGAFTEVIVGVAIVETGCNRPVRLALAVPHEHEYGADEEEAEQQADPETDNAPAALEAEVTPPAGQWPSGRRD